MKKTLILLITLFTLASLANCIYATDDNPNIRIFTAQDLIKEYNEGRLVPTNLAISEVLDDTGHYLRATATAQTKHILAWTLDTEIAPDFDIMVIGFRTNYTDTSSASRSFAIDFPKDETFNFENRYFVMKFDRKNIAPKNGMIEGEIEFDGLLKKFSDSGATTIKYIKINESCLNLYQLLHT